LQNVQDARSNCFRVTMVEDDLQRVTVPFKASGAPDVSAGSHSDDDDVDDDRTLQGQKLDDLLRLLNMEADSARMSSGSDRDNPEATSRGSLPSSLNLNAMRQKGVLQCGYECLAEMTGNLQPGAPPVIEVEQTTAAPNLQSVDGAVTDDLQQQQQTPPNQRDIVTLLMNRTTRRSRTFEEISKSKEPVNVLEANGSVKSIIDWTKKAKLDRGQRRAFEITTGTFILTFFSDASTETTESRGQTVRHSFITEKK